jgi:hypoxanthine phosphoribosyltransferase
MNFILSWMDIERDMDMLANKIKEQNFVPDYIVCVMRGGMILSRILSKHFNDKEILPFLINSYTKDNKRGGLILREFKYSFIKGKNVLICDEIVDSGETLKTVIEMVNRLKPKQIMTTALVLKNGCKTIPDFYIYNNVPKNYWVKFPWE